VSTPCASLVPIWLGFRLIVWAQYLGALNLFAVRACSPLIAVHGILGEARRLYRQRLLKNLRTPLDERTTRCYMRLIPA